MSQTMTRQKKLTVPKFVERKKSGQKLTMLTAYDFTMARLLDQSGIDCILVGDSMAMVVQGHETTLPVTLDEMIYHAKMVTRGAPNTMVIVDLPFPTNHLGVQSTIAAAGRVLKETGCTAVKLEGGKDQSDVISGLVAAGIPVMAHAGLRPQNVHAMGGYKVQREEDVLLSDGFAAQEAGAFSIVLECIPRDIAGKLSDELLIPTIGIGAGPDCDGQVLVIHDLIGLTTGYVPSFVKPFANVGTSIINAVRNWTEEVEQGQYPADEHSF